jgi:hypothetical protein
LLRGTRTSAPSARQVLRRWQRNRLRSLVLLQYDAIDQQLTSQGLCP